MLLIMIIICYVDNVTIVTSMNVELIKCWYQVSIQ